MNPILPRGPEIQRLTIRALELLGGRAHRGSITRRVIQIGGFTAEQLAVPAPSTNLGGFPNRIEYQVSNSLSALKKKGMLDNVGGGDWVLLD